MIIYKHTPHTPRKSKKPTKKGHTLKTIWPEKTCQTFVVDLFLYSYMFISQEYIFFCVGLKCGCVFFFVCGFVSCVAFILATHKHTKQSRIPLFYSYEQNGIKKQFPLRVGLNDAWGLTHSTFNHCKKQKKEYDIVFPPNTTFNTYPRQNECTNNPKKALFWIHFRLGHELCLSRVLNKNQTLLSHASNKTKFKNREYTHVYISCIVLFDCVWYRFFFLRKKAHICDLSV